MVWMGPILRRATTRWKAAFGGVGGFMLLVAAPAAFAFVAANILAGTPAMTGGATALLIALGAAILGPLLFFGWCYLMAPFEEAAALEEQLKTANNRLAYSVQVSFLTATLFPLCFEFSIENTRDDPIFCGQITLSAFDGRGALTDKKTFSGGLIAAHTARDGTMRLLTDPAENTISVLVEFEIGLPDRPLTRRISERLTGTRPHKLGEFAFSGGERKEHDIVA